MDPTSIGGFLQDMAPFLVPANWFRLKQAKLSYQAEQEGYRALWANEVMTAKGLYFHLLTDQSLLEHILQSQGELKKLLVLVEMHLQIAMGVHLTLRWRGNSSTPL